MKAAVLALSCFLLGLFFYEKLRFKPAPSPEPPPLGAGPAGEPPPPIHSLSGAPIGEPSAAPAAYTNEDLQKNIEEQKKAMGIKKIILPSREDADEGSPAEGRPEKAIFELSQLMNVRAAPQVLIEGRTPQITASTGKSDGPVSIVTPYAGTAVSRAKDAEAAWAEAGLDTPRPEVDFSKATLVIAPGPIESITEKDGRVVVQYHENGPQAARYAVMAKTSFPVVFERAP